MHLNYNGIDLDVEHTGEVNLRPVMDASGLDLLYQEVTVGMTCVLNPSATATNKPPFGGRGDRLGITVNNLKHLLMVPRKQIRLTLGKDRAFLAPLNGPDGQPLKCDPAGGPFPEECRVLEIIGDKTAVVYYRVRFHVTDCSRAVLSNRWSVSSVTDNGTGLTTRTISGRAVLRLDFLEFQKPRAVADQFRSAFAVDVPDGFMRDRVSVQATPDGRELVYEVIDKQTYLRLGANSPALRIRGHATAGTETPIKDVKSLAGAFAGPGFGWLKAGIMGDLRGVFGAEMAAVTAAWSNLVPNQKANVLVQVFGPPESDKADLADLAVQVAVDRFAPLWPANIYPVSAYLTQIFDTHENPAVELRMEFLPASLEALVAVLNPSVVGGVMKLSADIDGTGKPFGGNMTNPLTRGGDRGNPELPASNNMRGSWIAMLVTQTLKGECALPDDFPAENLSLSEYQKA